MRPPQITGKPDYNLPGAGRSGWQTLQSLLPYLWPKGSPWMRVAMALSILCLAGGSFSATFVSLVMGNAVDRLTPKAGAYTPLVVPVVIILGYGALRLGSVVMNEMRDALFSVVGQRATRKVAVETFIHMHSLSLRFHLDRQTGGLARAIDRGVLGIQTLLRFLTINIVPTVLQLVFVVGLSCLKFGVVYGAIILATVLIYIAFTFTYSAWRLKYRRDMNTLETESSTRAVDALLNYETVKYFNNEVHEAQRFDRAQARYEKAAVQSAITLNGLNIGQGTIISGALVLLMFMAAHAVINHHMTVGGFVALNMFLATQLAVPLGFLGFAYAMIQQGLVDIEQMFRLLLVPQEVADRAMPMTLPERSPERESCNVSFDQVHFGYRPDHEILKGISFDVPAGHKLGIVGHTGSGKSTIFRLLFRFYDVTEGAIRIDGIDVRDLSQDSLRRAIGVVPQDTVLFNDTIGYNIAYGKPGATRQEIEAAARAAQVHDFVMRMPDGYNTKVGERGLKLSGGEKQRVAIARTILKNPRILILDEATSALDTRTEREIQSALRTISESRTTLVIAHRLSTVVDADEIIVMGEGRILERGNHSELLGLDGVYARMWEVQQQEQQAATEVAADGE